MNAESEETLRARLNIDPLRHITPLKMLGMYGARAECESFGNAHVLWMPGNTAQYDADNYPSAAWVVYPALAPDASAGDIDAAANRTLALANHQTICVKVSDERFIHALRARASVKRARALCTFLLDDATQTHSEPHVSSSAQMTSPVSALSRVHGVYSEGELAAFFSSGESRGHWIEVDGEPVAVALTFPTTQAIHEIGGLHVLPHARRRGHAAALLRHAAHDLRSRGKTVRYVVDENNEPSIALANGCGLKEAFRLQHFLLNVTP
jgi:ribosomal protein S18 acetylase RimI-like enzyme